jgi:hypothetical protein
LRDSFHEQVQLAERSSDDIEAEMRGEKQLSLVAVGGDQNNRQTAAATSIQLTRQVMRLVAQAQKEKQAKLAGSDASSSAAAAAAAPVDTSSSTFRITFPVKVAPNYEILQKLLYARGAASAGTTDGAPEGVLAAGAEVVRARRKLLAKQKVHAQDGEIEEGEVEEGEVEDDDADMAAAPAAAEPEAEAEAGADKEQAEAELVAPEPFTQTKPVFDAVEPVKPAGAAAAKDETAAAAVPAASPAAADVEAEIAGLNQLTVPKIKDQLKQLGLKVDGNKAALIERLSEALRENAKAAPAAAEESAPAAAAAGGAAASSAETAQYEKDLASYNSAKAAHESALAAFQEAEQAHKDAVSAYEAQVAKKDKATKKQQSPKKSKSPAKGKKAAAADEAEIEAADADMADDSTPTKKKRGGSYKKKKVEQQDDEQEEKSADAAPAAAVSSAAPAAAASSAADIPPSPHSLTVELLPRVHARHDYVRRNQVRFTPTQVEAIKSGLQPGLTMIVGPPGTGQWKEGQRT